MSRSESMKSEKTYGTRRAGSPRPAAFSDPAVDATFSTYRQPVRARLLALRRLIFETARATEGVGRIEETLRWGQPSYLTPDTKSGSTIRIDQVKFTDNQYAVHFHCQTDLIATFRELYPDEFRYGGNRSIVFRTEDAIPEPALRHCLALALTYHLNKRKGRGAR
jgi:hypothetical protein